LSEPQIVEPQDARWSQVVAALPESLFEDPVDALTPELLQALSAIDADWLLYLDPYLLADVLQALLEAGIDPLELDDIGLEDFFWLATEFLDDDLIDALEREIDENGGIIFDLEDQYGVEDDDPILDLEAYYASGLFDDDEGADFDVLLDGLSNWGVDPADDPDQVAPDDAGSADPTDDTSPDQVGDDGTDNGGGNG
ncbi:MAG: hypothetical protein NZM00_07230, partial [Anaerolinea sp.]|nr:hypothetical protein [Anaerolinea sp.]